MATTSSFDSMLNEYLSYDLLKEEMIKRDYLLNRVEKDNGWKNGTLIVPFQSAGASSIAFGELVASSNIAEDQYVRGEVSSYKELWGTMLFNQKDLMQHDGAVSEKSFLKILPDAVEQFMDRMKFASSVALLNGTHFATLTDNGTAGGLIEVDHPERFEIGQEVFLLDGNTALSASAFVSAININTKIVTLVTARGGAVAFADAQNYTVAQSAKVYHRGASTASFTSLRSALLPLSAGGSTTLYGQTKTAYPFLQSITVDGSAITAANILDKIFDAYVTVRTFGKGNPNEVLMSYKHLGSVLKLLEVSKGSFNVSVGSSKASAYGWTEIEIGSVKGSLKIVAIQELDDDIIMFIDWRAVKLHSNGMFKKRTAPDGKQYYEVRNTSGYQYLLDICFFGELVLSRPSYCGVIHSVSY